MSTSALAPTTTQSLESATTVDMHTPENASATEHTPLLSRDVPERGRQFYNIPTAPKSTSAPWLYHAVTLVFVFVSFLLCLAVGIILTGHSYAAPLLQADPALLAQRALAFEGPTHVNVLNYTSDGLWCEIAGAAAIDTALLLGLSSNRLTDKLVRWAVRQVGSITVSTSTVDIYSSTGAYLGGLQLPDIVLPLATQSPPPLANVTLQVLVQPTHSNQDLLNFVSRSWQAGFLHVRINISKVAVTGGEKTSNHSWKSNVHVIKHNIRSVFEVAIPPIPGLPPAPPNEPRPIPDLASLIYLQSYHVLPPPPTLRVVGAATLPNPAPAILQGVVALSLPFVVSLPAVGSGDPLALARVETAPLALTTPNISLVISGHVLPLPSSSNSVAPVSRFASDFLAARASPILVTTDFLRDIGMKEELTLEATFPAAEERPELLRDVQITNMRISLHGEQILASAFVRAHIVPPSNLAAIRVNATRVWPDLLVYDGPAPGMWPYDDPNSGSLSGIQYDEGFSEPEPMPLPMPLPPAAFARIRPESWVSAQTEDGEDGEGVWVHAQVSDVPLVVLPGRDAELRRFIRKVVFSSGGARAGVAGISAVAARVGGLVVGSKESGELEMFGLPLRGETWIGKKDVHEPGGGLPMPKNPFPEPSLPSPPSWHPSIPHIPHLPKISLPTPHLPIPTPEPKAEPEFLHEHWPIFGSDRSHNRQEGEEGEELEEEDSGELWQVGVAY